MWLCRREKCWYNNGITPDIVTCAKAMGNGFPLGACVMARRVADVMSPGSHGSTYGGNPLAMSVGNAVLDLLLDGSILQNVKKAGESLKSSCWELASQFPDLILEVRGEG